MSLFNRIKKEASQKLSDHKDRIVRLLKTGWYTQMDCANLGLTLNLSKRLGELEIELAPKWKVDRRWKEGCKTRCKEYRIVRSK
jgi:hypothetical protein